MYIDVVPNRNSPPAVLLRESRREGQRIRKVTLANLSMLPPHAVDALRLSLGKQRSPSGESPLPEDFVIASSLPFGHVVAVTGMMRKLGLAQLIDRKPTPQRQRALAMIAARVLGAASKLATSSDLAEDDALGALNLVYELGDVDSDDLYQAMDYLLERQPQIEKRLAAKHLAGGTLVLYDVSSTAYHGHTCPLARRGHSRDHRQDLPQIVYGLLCNAQGVPLAVEVFEGNTADPATLSSAIDKFRHRFGVRHVAIVADRGMITNARINEELKPAGIDYITALRSTSIRTLVEQKRIEMSLFDQQDLCEITSDDYPDERLIACFNPALADERARKREALLQATEARLQAIADATARKRNPLREEQAISLRVGKVIDQYKMAKHFTLTITQTSFAFERDQASIDREKALDGLYVIRTPLAADKLSADQAVDAYKRLASVERAFRCIKSVDLMVRPIHHRLADRVRAHVFLCMLAYHVQYHLRQALAPLLFQDDDKPAAQAERKSIVAPAQRSPSAKAKAASKRNAQGDRVQSFRSLLRSLSTLTLNRIESASNGFQPFHKASTPTPLQQKALDLLNVQPTL